LRGEQDLGPPRPSSGRPGSSAPAAAGGSDSGSSSDTEGAGSSSDAAGGGGWVAGRGMQGGQWGGNMQPQQQGGPGKVSCSWFCSITIAATAAHWHLAWWLLVDRYFGFDAVHCACSLEGNCQTSCKPQGGACMLEPCSDPWHNLLSCPCTHVCRLAHSWVGG
jgi:hypothetical protein